MSFVRGAEVSAIDDGAGLFLSGCSSNQAAPSPTVSCGLSASLPARASAGTAACADLIQSMQCTSLLSRKRQALLKMRLDRARAPHEGVTLCDTMLCEHVRTNAEDNRAVPEVRKLLPRLDVEGIVATLAKLFDASLLYGRGSTLASKAQFVMNRRYLNVGEKMVNVNDRLSQQVSLSLRHIRLFSAERNIYFNASSKFPSGFTGLSILFKSSTHGSRSHAGSPTWTSITPRWRCRRAPCSGTLAHLTTSPLNLRCDTVFLHAAHPLLVLVVAPPTLPNYVL